MITLLRILPAAILALAAQTAIAQDQPFVPMPLKKIAKATQTDPLGIWTDAEVLEDVDHKADIWAGTHKTPQGTLVISQLVAAGTCSLQDCPVRVVLIDKAGRKHVLVQYELYCASGDFYAIRRDLGAFKACETVVPLTLP